MDHILFHPDVLGRCNISTYFSTLQAHGQNSSMPNDPVDVSVVGSHHCRDNNCVHVTPIIWDPDYLNPESLPPPNLLQ